MSLRARTPWASALAAVVLVAGCSAPSPMPSPSSTPGPSGTVLPTIQVTSPSDDTPPAGDLWKQTRTASLAAQSATMTALMTTNGKKTDLKISGRVDGSNMTQTLKGSSAQDKIQGNVSVLTVGGKYYVKGDQTFWKANSLTAEQAAVAAAKYVEMPAASVTMFRDLTIGKLLRELFATEDMGLIESLTTTVRRDSVNNTPAYVLTTASQGVEMAVTADGEAHLLQLTMTYNGQPALLTFGAWDAVPAVQPPAAKDIISRG